MDMHTKLQTAASSVPLSATGLSLAGLSLQEWMYAATIGWIVVQLGFFLYDRIKKARADNDRSHEWKSD